MPGRTMILGGGPAGLYVARRLAEIGRPVVVLEREPVPGGLSASLSREGNFYGHGFHSLHDSDPAWLDEFRGLVGGAWREFPRDIAMIMRGRYLDYPLRTADLLRAFPVPILVAAGAGFLGALAAAPLRRVPPRNAEEAIVRLYGRPLYRSYFAEYTDVFWGRPAAGISARFVEERLPRFDPADRLRRVFGGEARKTEIGRPTMATTARGAGFFYESLADAVRAAGGEIRTGAEVLKVFCPGGRAVGVRVREDSRELEFEGEAVVSTIPLGQLIPRLHPAPPDDVVRAAFGLKGRGLVTTGLLVARDRVLPHGLVYFRGRAFHRLSEPKIGGVGVHPAGHTILLAETTADPGDAAWNHPAGLVDRVVNDLVEDGLIDRKSVRQAHSFRTPDAYPLFSLGFESQAEMVRRYLGQIGNFVSTGRQGRFSFLRSAEAMKTAWRDTRAVLGIPADQSLGAAGDKRSEAARASA